MTRARDVANVLTAANVLSTDIESAAAISAHTGITDPHPAYLQESTFSANQIVYKNASNEATGSANLTFSGSDLAVAGTIRSTASTGDEGGEIFLNKSVTNTTLTGGVVLDVNQNRLRFFEQGGTNRGYYLDIASAGAGVATNLGSSGGMTLIGSTSPTGTNTVTFSSIPSTYSDLQLVFYNVRQAATGTDTIGLTVNGITGANCYYYQRVSGSTAGGTNFINIPVASVLAVNGSTAGGFVYLPNYTDSTSNGKIITFYTNTLNNNTAFNTASWGNGSAIGTSANAYNGVGAITSITLTMTNNYAAGTFLLYGVK